MAEPNGFYYMRARYYDPNVGRFISEDPSGFGGGDVNLMAYVGNNPINYTDPLGLCGNSWLSSLSNFVGGIVNYVDRYVSLSDTATAGFEGLQMSSSGDRDAMNSDFIGSSLDLNIGGQPTPDEDTLEFSFGVGHALSIGVYFIAPRGGDISYDGTGVGVSGHFGLGFGFGTFLGVNIEVTSGQ